MDDCASDSGERFGPYVVTSKLGAGGMGVVYRARDERLGRDVAIKVVRPGLLANDEARTRFRLEALALGKLNHPNIAAVYDVGFEGGSDYLVMEFVTGQTLRERLAAGPLPVKEILSLGSEIADALEGAHEQGVVHRDVKPANIMVTAKGRAKILDFGLARLVGATNGNDITMPVAETGGIVGTPLYMSPEQAVGKPIDGRTDLWSLGVVLYEALAGKAPFRGDSGLAILRSITQDAPDPLRIARADIPVDAERIVSRALEKNADARYQSAAEMSRELSAAVARLSSPPQPRTDSRIGVPRSLAVALVLLLVVAAAGGIWFYHRIERRRWAREVAVPRALDLFRDDRPLAAFELLKDAERWMPGDRALAKIEAEHSETVSVDSSPRGAVVDLQDYLDPEMTPVRLGVTPLRDVRIPKGYFRWKISGQSGGEIVTAPLRHQKMVFDLNAQRAAPAGMTCVSGSRWADMIAFMGWIGPYDLPAYDIDRFEVTNRDYQRFVDSGGYETRKYWNEKFLRLGRELTWDEAIALLRDRTGRSGPATWEGGHYPEGHADDPVSGVSWYEASAYASFVGKSLPVLAQWYRAAPPEAVSFAVQKSNIARDKPSAAGAFKGLGPYGTFDMVGNVREWVENAAADDTAEHFILGGAWNSPTYLAVDPEALPAFDRSSANGFRCVRNRGPLPSNAAAAIKTLSRDFSTFKPASDEVFAVYRALYSYDTAAPLNARSEGVLEDAADWRKEKITFDAAYGNERVTAYLFLPKRVHPPFETIVFFPSARVLDLRDSRALGDVAFFDYVVQSGRAVLYPIYKGTYERQDRFILPGNRKDIDAYIQRFRDLGRAVDYLRTRHDIDSNRVAYLGVSMGAAEGVIYTTLLQDAFRSVIFLDGGYFLNRFDPGGDQADFAPRLKLPVLMVNGRYDFTFSLERSQEPLFRMLGTPIAKKRHVVLDTPHDVRARKTDLIAAVLPWLDETIGKVRQARQ
jgi:predicted Ser/Thr protein kinase/dienelactone hydrolase